jgi:RNA polymerase-interacting CarD/CdnL/TRCF family regulator
MRTRQHRVGTSASAPQEPTDEKALLTTLAVGEVVVYAAHGIGRVEARRPGRGDLPETIVVAFATGLRVTLPIARAQRALRSLSGELELEDVGCTLRANPTPAIEPWSKRFNLIRERVNAGEVRGLAEVVRDGHQREQRLALRQGSQSASATGERALYLQARKLLAEEIALARGIQAAEADEWIVDQIDTHAQA